MKYRATAHILNCFPYKKTSCSKYQLTNYRHRKGDSKQIQLTGSLVFDEEKLEALLESVFIHIEFYLHPMRKIERQRDRHA